MIIWVLILGVIVGLGELITKYGNGNELGDGTVPRWLAAHRTPAETHWSLIFTTLGGAAAIVIASLVAGAVFLAITHRWRPVVYIGALMAGEITAFLAAAAIIRRPRPPVPRLDQHLPTSSYPPGHTAATCCINIFVGMPFADDLGDLFHYGIQPAIGSAGYLCERVDQVPAIGDILARIKERIRTASFVVAELTGASPNVYLEVVCAWGCGIPTVLLIRKNAVESLKFDVAGQRCINYSSIRDLEEKLSYEFNSLAGQF